MNIALLLKWWWKLKQESYSSLWKTVVCYKYYNPSSSMRFSPLWKEIHELEPIGQVSVCYQVGSESNLLFWTDIWVDNCCLASRYPHLFANCEQPNILVHEVFRSQGAALSFIIHLDGVLLREWSEILGLVSHTALLMCTIR